MRISMSSSQCRNGPQLCHRLGDSAWPRACNRSPGIYGRCRRGMYACSLHGWDSLLVLPAGWISNVFLILVANSTTGLVSIYNLQFTVI